MFNNWHKKEKPIQGMMGMGGGATGYLTGASGPSINEATGGTKVVGGDGYTRHYFDDPAVSYTFSLDNGPGEQFRMLIVGGGAGGGVIGGGGGGGGVIKAPSFTMPSGFTWNISIGSGGVGGGSGTPGQNGGDTTVQVAGQWTLTAKGGGGGGGHAGGPNGTPGQPGGSGGGAADNSSTHPFGQGIQPTQNPGFSIFPITQHGFPGGRGSTPGFPSTPRQGGAGGGAGGAGTGWPGRAPGGNGVPDDILGTNYYWGAGGGAGTYPPSTGGGNGGLGGGGGGYSEDSPYGSRGGSAWRPGPSPATPAAGGPAADNSGSGGGGAQWSGPHAGTRTGAHGVVIIRYPHT